VPVSLLRVTHPAKDAAKRTPSAPSALSKSGKLQTGQRGDVGTATARCGAPVILEKAHLEPIRAGCSRRGPGCPATLRHTGEREMCTRLLLQHRPARPGFKRESTPLRSKVPLADTSSATGDGRIRPLRRPCPRDGGRPHMPQPVHGWTTP
jgi:hypothetical protein